VGHTTTLTTPHSGSAIEPKPAFTIARSDRTLILAGDLTIASGSELWRKLREQLDDAQEPIASIDLTRARSVDGVGASILGSFRSQLATRGVDATVVGANQQVSELLGLFEAGEQPERPRTSFVERVGQRTVELGAGLRNIVAFIGELTVELVGAWRRPRTANWRSTIPLAERAGADAVPIVLLINFLVGLVMAHHSAAKLRQYGASLYVADIVVLSVTRELAPLMTAIILAGRSGAAFTAEIATMKVSEEIDALRAMGFGPVRYLALPRLLALGLVAPLLVVLGDMVGILGGMVMAWVGLEVSPTAFFNEALRALRPFDVIGGLIKSVVFGWAIGVIACQRGFAAKGGAAEVGDKTTSTVVTCLFGIVLLDAVLTILFQVIRSI